VGGNEGCWLNWRDEGRTCWGGEERAICGVRKKDTHGTHTGLPDLGGDIANFVDLEHERWMSKITPERKKATLSMRDRKSEKDRCGLPSGPGYGHLFLVASLTPSSLKVYT
jgi:hypothetical protein